MRVVIADDEPLARALLRELLAEHPDVELVGEAASGEGAIARALQHRPDAVFLDIEMGGRSGVVAALEMAPLGLEVVFVTAYDAYAVEAFELGAADYILKPLRRDRLAVALSRLRARLAARDAAGPVPEEPDVPQAIWVSTRQGLVPVRWPDVVRVEAARDHVYLHTAERAFLHRCTMASLEAPAAQAGLLRVHRSAFVRPDAVRALQRRGRSLVLETADGALIPVGPSYRAAVVALTTARP